MFITKKETKQALNELCEYVCHRDNPLLADRHIYVLLLTATEGKYSPVETFLTEIHNSLSEFEQGSLGVLALLSYFCADKTCLCVKDFEEIKDVDVVSISSDRQCQFTNSLFALAYLQLLGLKLMTVSDNLLIEAIHWKTMFGPLEMWNVLSSRHDVMFTVNQWESISRQLLSTKMENTLFSPYGIVWWQKEKRFVCEHCCAIVSIKYCSALG